MLKRTLLLLLLLVAFGVGAWLSYQYIQKRVQTNTITDATVLLEQVQQVRKLVTVEGQFSELYDETDIKRYTVYLPFPTAWSFSKQAIIKITGKVLVGYDLNDIAFTVDSTGKRLILSNLPEPEILSVDHEVNYKNLEESYFNSFTPADYTRLNKNAKAVLTEKAKESGLLEKAKAEGDQMIAVMRLLVESGGWELVVEPPKEVLMD